MGPLGPKGPCPHTRIVYATAAHAINPATQDIIALALVTTTSNSLTLILVVVTA